jgi:hypothetical protein
MTADTQAMCIKVGIAGHLVAVGGGNGGGNGGGKHRK